MPPSQQTYTDTYAHTLDTNSRAQTQAHVPVHVHGRTLTQRVLVRSKSQIAPGSRAAAGEEG